MRITSVTDLAREVASDPQLAEQIKANPVEMMASLAGQPRDVPDTFIFRVVVISLGGTVVLAVIGAIAIAFAGKTAPDLLTALGSAAVGALAGLLAPSPMVRP
jgi:hypothetical protein